MSSDYGDFCREQRVHRRQENFKWLKKRTASIEKNAVPMGLAYAMRDEGGTVRIWSQRNPSIQVDWYLSSGKLLHVGGESISVYCRDLAAVAALLTEQESHV